MTQYTMQAQASDSKLLYYWGSSSRDYAGAGYPGTGTPQEVAVAAFQPADVSGVVDSFSGRTGVVSPQAGDYDAADILDLTAANVEFDPSANPLSATDVQGAIEELTTKPATVKSETFLYFLLPADVGQVVVGGVSAVTAFNITDSASFPIGSVIELVQGVGCELMSIVAGAGTTIQRAPFTTPEMAGEGSTSQLRKISAGVWFHSGDLKKIQPSFRFKIEDVSVTGVGSQMNATSLSLVAGNNIAEIAELSSGQVRILQSGTWLFSANISVADSESGTSRSVTLDLEQNGVSVIAFNGRREGATASLLVPIRGSFAATIGAGDLIAITTNSSGTINPTSGSTQRDFWAQRISD